MHSSHPHHSGCSQGLFYWLLSPSWGDFAFYPCGIIVHGPEFHLCGDRHVLLKLHSSCNFFVIHLLSKILLHECNNSWFIPLWIDKDPWQSSVLYFCGYSNYSQSSVRFLSFMFSLLLVKQKSTMLDKLLFIFLHKKLSSYFPSVFYILLPTSIMYLLKRHLPDTGDTGFLFKTLI